MSRKTTFTLEEDKFIKDNYLTMPIKAIGKKIGRSYTGIMSRLKFYNLEIPLEIRQQRKRATNFKKGNIPFNKGKKMKEYATPEFINTFKKTTFKKGNKPHNTRKKGEISIIKDSSSDRYYKFIKIADANWELLSRYNYKKHKGEIPDKMLVTYIDGDSLNCHPENLTLITRAQNVRNNSITNYPPELQLTIKLINKLNKNLKQNKDGK